MKRIKAVLASILTAVLILSAAFISSMAIEVTVYGDTNLSGGLDISDATMVQQNIAKLITLTEQQLKNAMVENGETLSIADATRIQQMLAKLIDVFPVEKKNPTEESSVSDNTELSTQTEAPSTEAPSTEAPSIEEPTAELPTQPEEDKFVKNVDIYFSNNQNWTNVNAYLFDYSTSAEKSTWPGDKMTYVKTNEFGEKIYKMNVDLEKYDRVIFNDGGSNQTTDTPVSAANTGYFINKKGGNTKKDNWVCGLYPYDASDEVIYKTVTLPYPKSSTYAAYNKKISVILPKDYTTGKKYSVVYMLDGQNQTGLDPNCAANEWEADETIISLNKNTGEDIIIVGIDNCVNRDSELTPPITNRPTDPSTNKQFTVPTGDVFERFVMEKVIPYVESNYSVNGVRGIVGSSSGGIEAFYIGMENPTMFKYVGALSPAFLLFTENEWDQYLSQKDFSGNVPKVHLYFGDQQRDTLEHGIYLLGKDMESWMKSHGYSENLIKTTVDKDAYHNELFWAVTLPETLSFGLGYAR